MVDDVSGAATGEPEALPLPWEEGVPTVVPEGGEEDGLGVGAVGQDAGVGVEDQHGVVGEVELVTGGEGECVAVEDSGGADDDMGSGMVPVGAVDDAVPCGVGGFQAVEDGVTSPGGHGEPLAVGEEDSVFDDERSMGRVGSEIGLDEDEDAVASEDFHITSHHRGVAIDIEAEAAAAASGKGDVADQHVFPATVIDFHIASGAAEGGEEGVEGHGVGREFESHLAFACVVSFFAREGEPRKENQQHHVQQPFHLYRIFCFHCV